MHLIILCVYYYFCWLKKQCAITTRTHDRRNFTTCNHGEDMPSNLICYREDKPTLIPII